MTASSWERLRRGLRTRIVGRDIHAYELVTSTNDVAWELADRGAEEGTVVLAEGQTQGRGRLGRSWWSPRGKGIWMSVLLRPPVREGAVPVTTIIGALATADAIRSRTGLPAMVRWPNDILVDGKKVAGVLVEVRVRKKVRELVLGIGIDVAAWSDSERSDMPEELEQIATTLSDAAGEEVERVALTKTLLEELDRWYKVKLEGGLDTINERWRELSSTLGKQVTLEENGRLYDGTVIDVDVRFGLALRLSSGSIRHFRGEHVSVISHG